jgi:hypothetical protein
LESEGMAFYKYRSVDQKGKVVKGSLEAVDKTAAVFKVKQKGLIPLEVSIDNDISHWLKKLNYNRFFDEYDDAISYLDLLTFITFENKGYKIHTFLIPECFEPFDLYSIDRSIKNIIITLLVLATSRKDEEENDNIRFCVFDKLYDKLKKNENLILDKKNDELIKYVSETMENYMNLRDSKMRILSLISILELLVAHSPDSVRYNIEDSIRKQFANKILLILYLNNNCIDNDEIEKQLLLFYDLRSCIAHGSFNKIESVCNKIDIWYEKNDCDDKKYKHTYDVDSVLDRVDSTLRDYLRIILKKFLSDKKLFEILKK